MELEKCIAHIRDPRDSKNQKYSLSSLMLIIFASLVSGIDTTEEMVEFAKLKKDWLNQYADLPRAPSAETLRYLICAINPVELIKGFESFVETALPKGTKDYLSVDGKTMRGTASANQDALHVISAWSQARGITLGALESAGKKNEIKTIPKLLDKLTLENSIVTTDAMGCQKEIAGKIQAGKGDYVLQLKANHDNLFKEIQAYYHKLQREKFIGTEYAEHEEINKGHGRLEIRCYTQFELSDWVTDIEQWPGLRTAIAVNRRRESNGETQEETSWYLSSLPITDSAYAAKAIRCHWEVENKLHWRLDVLFREDDCRLHSGFASLNMAVLKRFSMNLLTVNDVSKRRMKHRILTAAFDDDYRASILFGNTIG